METLPHDELRSHADRPLLSGTAGAAFGEFLRQAREHRGLTLQQISKETKIPVRHLNALEHGDLSAVPRGYYRRAEIRAFAQTVGLDQKLALAELERALAASAAREAPPSEPQPTQSRPGSRRLVPVVVGALTIVVATAVALWNQKPALQVDAVEAVGGQEGSLSPVSREAAAQPEPTSQTTIPLSEPVSLDRAAPPTPADGELVVTTEPAGARVTVNGVGWGVTPVTIRHLPLGDKRIRVTKEGYAGEERRVQLAEDRPSRTLHIELIAQIR